MQKILISRYPSEERVSSDLHLLDDALDLLSFLQAEKFVTAQLVKQHQKTTPDATALAKRISSHANLAVKYATLSLSAAPEISFLPGYYSILNLAKCISLSGPYSNEFDQHSRWHGATYNTQGKASQSILTDEIRVRSGGALALFYKSLTNRAIAGDKVLKLKSFYHLIPGIGAELSLVAGQDVFPWYLNFSAGNDNGTINIEAQLVQWDRAGRQKAYKGNVRTIPCLKGFKKKPKTNGVFTTSFPATQGVSLINEVRGAVSTGYLVRRGHDSLYACYEQSSTLPMTEEFAIALAFFHLSSVCRYNPEFVKKLANSKAWPMLLVLRRQALFYFITATWSYFIQKNYILKAS